MVLAPHMLVGATIGSRLSNYPLILLLSLLLHFLFDRLPHWEYESKVNARNMNQKRLSSLFFKALLDLGAGAAVLCLFWQGSSQWPYVLFGAFLSIVPDGLVFLHHLIRVFLHREFPPLIKFYHFHELIHIHENKPSSPLGLATQSLVIIGAIFLFSWAP